MKYLKHGMIIMACMLLLFMTGCGQIDPPTDARQETTENGSLDQSVISWQADYFRLGNQYAQALAAEDIYGCYLEDDRILLDVVDRQDFAVKETLALSGATEVTGMAVGQEGVVYLLGSKGESTGLWRIDPEGNLSDCVEMELEDTEEVVDLSLKGIYTDQDGILFVWCEMMASETEMIEGMESDVWHWEDRVYVKDGQLDTIFYEKIADRDGTDVLNFQVGTDGRPVFIVKDSDGVYMQEIDVAQKGRKEAVRLDKSGDIFGADSVNSLENIVSIDDGLLFCNNNELFEYHFHTQTVEKRFNLSTYGIFSSDLLFLGKDGDTIEMIDNHEGFGKSEFISFALGESEKGIVTLGSTSMVPDLEKVVAEFNRYSGEYRVEIVDYVASEETYEDAVEQLKLDIVSGTAPDMITLGGINYSMLSEKGALADLYDFMAEDEECPKDLLVQSVAEACEDQGHLYGISPSFQLHSMWGYGDVTGGRSGVTFEELFRMLENSGKDLNAIAGFAADEPVLTRLCTVSMDEFIDWENGTCDFEGDYFKQALSFAREYTGNYMGGTYSERIGKREVVLSVGIISSVADYQIQKELYGGDVAFVGYPVAAGSGTAVGFRGIPVAINARKEDRTGAWEFVKYYLLHGYDGQGFPLVREQFDRVLDAAMEEDYGVSEDGGTERNPKGYYNDGGGQIFVYAAAQEDVDAVRGLVESAGNRCESNPVIQDIINEEAAGYFSGQVDLDSTVEKIQNRVTLFLQESFVSGKPEANIGTSTETNTETDTSVDEIYWAVFLGETQFYYHSVEEMQAVTITDVPSLFDADDPYMKIWEFAVADLDRNGEDEVILFVAGAAGDTGGKVILHQSGDKVYGYLTDNRTLVDLKIDGTFNFSDPTGVTEAGIAAIASFAKEGYTIDKISYEAGTHKGWDTFVVDHHSATEEEYRGAFSRQEKKQNVEWNDFNNENINTIFKGKT